LQTVVEQGSEWPVGAAAASAFSFSGRAAAAPGDAELTLWGPGVRPDPLSCSAR
jgi:hypothetical protein